MEEKAEVQEKVYTIKASELAGMLNDHAFFAKQTKTIVLLDDYDAPIATLCRYKQEPTVLLDACNVSSFLKLAPDLTAPIFIINTSLYELDDEDIDSIYNHIECNPNALIAICDEAIGEDKQDLYQWFPMDAFFLYRVSFNQGDDRFSAIELRQSSEAMLETSDDKLRIVVASQSLNNFLHERPKSRHDLLILQTHFYTIGNSTIVQLANYFERNKYTNILFESTKNFQQNEKQRVLDYFKREFGEEAFTITEGQDNGISVLRIKKKST